ncbi:hypothetical protein OAX78_00900, partial [Planctomycetota bacterium]|nr:hypothetical protein [Planctomycetota bacterium]
MTDPPLNSLDRYRKTPRGLVREVHGPCEVPAGCGGSVIRWRNPNDGVPIVFRVYTPGQATLLLDGEPLTSNRPVVGFGRHVLGIALGELPSSGAACALTGTYDPGAPGPETDLAHPNAIHTAGDQGWLYLTSAPDPAAWTVGANASD